MSTNTFANCNTAELDAIDELLTAHIDAALAEPSAADLKAARQRGYFAADNGEGANMNLERHQKLRDAWEAGRTARTVSYQAGTAGGDQFDGK